MNLVSHTFRGKHEVPNTGHSIYQYDITVDESFGDTWRMGAMCKGVEMYDKMVEAGLITNYKDIETAFNRAFELLKEATS